MRILSGLAALSVVLGAFLVDALERRTPETHDFFALHIDDSLSPSQVAQTLGVRHEGQIGELKGHHKFSLPKDQTSAVESLLDELRLARRRRRRRRRRSGGVGIETEAVGVAEEEGDSSSRPGPGADDPELQRRTDVLDGIRWSQKLVQRQRLVKRLPPSTEYTSLASSSSSTGWHMPHIKRANDPSAVQTQKRIASSLGIRDPIFEEQWHLYNTVQLGHDLNVTGVWLEGITGQNVVSAVIDDGLDMYSADLQPNYDATGSWDFNDHTAEPKPRLFDDKHGTRCAGEIAAAKNDVCGLGVAYDSKVSGIRILSAPIDDADEALAINYAFQHNDIYSCSWGPPDDGKTMEEPGLLIRKALVNGVQKGREGKGSIFVFAAGNGGVAEDNCNFDGYTNSIYSITVGAIDRQGSHPAYSESCSAQLVVAYSSGSGDAIHTTDVGPNSCSTVHGGTSAAGPLAVGCAALALSVRPELTWRDAQYLFVETAVPVHEDDGSWQTTKAGRKFSHDWGYGKVDVYTLVQKAKEWDLVKPQAWYHSPWLRVEHKIPEGDQGLASSFPVTAEIMKSANLERLEHVTVTMNVQHTRRGDLSVELHSPEGVVSHLSTSRRFDEDANGYVDWTFMTVAHWGESGIGTWTVIVKDTESNAFNGTFIDWRLNLWGEAIDASIQTLHPLPEEQDDEHNIEDAIVVTTSVVAAPTKTATAVGDTGDQVDRPVKVKPTSTAAIGAIVSTATLAATATATATAATGSPASSTSDSFLPSFFPTFGASRRTQIWIYASFVLIIVFCLGLGTYFYIQQRKRLRNNPHDEYEFEMIENSDDLQALNGASRHPRRGGELYNAFAGESDEELFSQDESEQYQDEDKDERPMGGSQENLLKTKA